MAIFQKEKEDAAKAYEATLNELKEQHAAELERIKQSHIEDLEKAAEKHDGVIKAHKIIHQEQVDKLEARIGYLEGTISTMNTASATLNQKAYGEAPSQ